MATFGPFGFTRVSVAPANGLTATAVQLASTASWKDDTGVAFSGSFFVVIRRPGAYPDYANAEIALVSAYDSTGITTMTRAQKGTTALNIGVGDEVYPYPTISVDNFISVNGNPYAVTQAGIQSAVTAAGAAGGGRVVVAAGKGAVLCATGVTTVDGVMLELGEGTWLEATGSSSYTVLGTSSHVAGWGSAQLLAANVPEGAMTCTLVTGGVATLGLVEDGYCLIGDATLGVRFQVNRIRHITGDNLFFYDPLTFAYTTVDGVRLFTPNTSNFTFKGEIRRGSNTGDTFAIRMTSVVGCTIKESKFNGFKAPNGLGTAVLFDSGGYQVQLLNNRDKGSGSGGYAAYELSGVSRYTTHNNQTDPNDPLTVVRANVAQAGGATTITLDVGASGVDNAYNTNIIQLVSGTGAGQKRAIASYVGATKVATVAQSWRVTPDNTTRFVIFTTKLVQGAGDLEGFGFLYTQCNFGVESLNGFASGNGRGIKHQNTRNWSDTNSFANGTPYALTAYAIDGASAHFTCTGVEATANAASGLWLTSLSGASPSDGHFIGCRFQNSDQDYGFGFEGSADISITSPTADMSFTDCTYKTVFDGGTRTMWNGVMRFGAVSVGPSVGTEVGVLSLAVPNGFLEGPGNGFEYDLPFYMTNNSAGSQTIRWRGYYTINAVDNNIFDVTTIALPNSATARGGRLLVKVTNRASSSIQDTIVESHVSATAASTLDIENQTFFKSNAITFSEVNPITLKITCTLSASDANLSLVALANTIRFNR